MSRTIKIDNLDTEKFNLCQNDEDRVKLTVNSMSEPKHVTCNCPHGQKYPEESEKLRNSGNDLLNSDCPDLEEVLKLYSGSILYALPGSNELSLAYANRSAVLFRAKYYKECLEDIGRALETGYPDSLKPKLLIRRVTCNYALTGNVDFAGDKGLIEARALIEKLPATDKTRKMVEGTLNDRRKITSVGRQVKKTCPKYRPEMKGRNSQLPGASDAIALRYTEKFGRHFVATRNIKSGEALFIEKPYATMVEDEWIYCICNYCVKRTWNGIPCDHCIYAMYCSDECKQAAWNEYHDVECDILGFAKEIVHWNHGLMGLRITVKAIKGAGSVEALRKRLRELESVKASHVEIPMNPNTYETLYMMSNNLERQEHTDMISSSSMAAILTYSLAVRTNFLGKKETGSFRVVMDSEKLLFVAGLMSRNIRLSVNRTAGLQCMVGKDSPMDCQILSLVQVSSFLNNRCYDAADLLRFDEDVILVTNIPIKKGEQVYGHYCGDYRSVPRDARKEFFEKRGEGDCNCLACKKNWSASTSTHWIEQDLSQRIMVELLEKFVGVDLPDVNETSGPIEMIKIKNKFHQLIDFVYPRVKKPCVDVEMLVDTINSIYAELSSIGLRFVEQS